MDTTKYIKPCPRCGTDIEPKRHASWGVHALAGVAGVCGGVIGFAFGGPVGELVVQLLLMPLPNTISWV